jgi:hypothetical protein
MGYENSIKKCCFAGSKEAVRILTASNGSNLVEGIAALAWLARKAARTDAATASKSVTIPVSRTAAPDIATATLWDTR